MSVIAELKESTDGGSAPPRVRMKILDQMAEALEDQVAALYRRAAAFEEEEFLLTREVEERQTEINRLMLKLEAMRAERERLTQRIESISGEAEAMREEIFSSEDEIAFAFLQSPSPQVSTESQCDDDADSSPGAPFFRRMTPAQQIRRA